jgi:hypothetical protein
LLFTGKKSWGEVLGNCCMLVIGKMPKTSVDLFVGHRSWLLALSMAVIGQFQHFFFCEDVTEQVLDLLFKDLDIAIVVGISCINNLLPIQRVGSFFKMDFKF